ncbi:hypothetical protein HY995_02830, partial [Candidatus Micrarchaeota archaeon]|nr:hypothetical protein [Candidatus Micrarchaeota archaeon]
TTSLTFTKPQLSQNAFKTDSFSYNCTTAGNHTIASTADSANKITEVTKLNNNASLTIACAIAPDLSSVLYAPYAVTVGKMAYAPIGSSINVTENTWNYGLAPSPASTTSVLYDGASRTFAKPALQPRGGSTSSFSYACASAGARFINSTADYNNAIAETNETNNADWLAVNCTTGLPDLLSSLTVPNTIFSNGAFYAKFGSTVTVVETTWNTGPSPAGASVTRASLPPRKAGGQSQTLYFNKPALAPGRGYSTPGYFYCGASFYTASATADYNNRVVEGNEGNNFNTITILCV